MIPFKIKLLTETAKAPERANKGDLWDLFADDFCQLDYFEAEKNNPDNCNEFNPIVYGEEGNLSQKQEIVFERVRTDEYDELFDGMGIYCEYWKHLTTFNYKDYSLELHPQGRILVKTGIALELPIKCDLGISTEWLFKTTFFDEENDIKAYAVADLRPRSGLALKHGITILNSPGTIDNCYRKEIGVILYNAGYEPYIIKKGDKIAQMLIRPLYPSKMEIVKDFKDTGRGGFGSTGK